MVLGWTDGASFVPVNFSLMASVKHLIKWVDDLRKICEHCMKQVLSEGYDFNDVELNKCYGMMM